MTDSEVLVRVLHIMGLWRDTIIDSYDATEGLDRLLRAERPAEYDNATRNAFYNEHLDPPPNRPTP